MDVCWHLSLLITITPHLYLRWKRHHVWYVSLGSIKSFLLQMRSLLPSDVLDPWLWIGRIRLVDLCVLRPYVNVSWGSVFFIKNSYFTCFFYCASFLHRQAESKSYFPPKGYAFLLFQVIWSNIYILIWKLIWIWIWKLIWILGGKYHIEHWF